MNLYLISQSTNADYDTYDAAVVCAESGEQARFIHPAGAEYNVPDSGVGIDKDYGCWTGAKNVQVQLLGTANPSIKQGVVLASFNAG